MRALALALAFVLSLAGAARAEYRIVTKAGAVYWSPQKPKLKGGHYLFRDRDGTYMSLRAADVAKVESATASREKVVIQNRPSPASAASASKEGREKKPDAPKPAPTTPDRDTYKPGVGVAPGTPDQYQPGRTLAPPPSGKVYEGPPPTLDTPPPPPPPPPPSR